MAKVINCHTADINPNTARINGLKYLFLIVKVLYIFSIAIFYTGLSLKEAIQVINASKDT